MKPLHELAKHYNAQKPLLYIDLYTQFFADRVNSIHSVLEIGVQGGGSLKMWRDYFPNATVVGIDIDDCSAALANSDIKFFQGRQEDNIFLERVLSEASIDKFDLIVDDASHFGLYSKKSFEFFFDKHLMDGGFYIIEDWGTGYWQDWPDGTAYIEPTEEIEREGKQESYVYRPDEATGLLPKLFESHQGGMVGFIKQLVDEAHRGAIKNLHPWRLSRFRHMVIGEGVVLIQKKFE